MRWDPFREIERLTGLVTTAEEAHHESLGVAHSEGDHIGAPEEAVITTVDAALGFVAGQRWVPQQMAVALLETIRDVTRDLDAPEHLDALIDAALKKCDSDPILAGALTDSLLDIRNATSQERELTRPGVR